MLAAVPGNQAAVKQHFNVCSDRAVTFVGICKAIGKALGKEPRIVLYSPEEVSTGPAVAVLSCHAQNVISTHSLDALVYKWICRSQCRGALQLLLQGSIMQRLQQTHGEAVMVFPVSEPDITFCTHALPHVPWWDAHRSAQARAARQRASPSGQCTSLRHQTRQRGSWAGHPSTTSCLMPLHWWRPTRPAAARARTLTSA